MIYSIIIWLAVKSDKGVSLYQTKYDVICVTTLNKKIKKNKLFI
jgi:hypothetical protein